MPMKTIRPPGQIASNRLGATFWLPEHSKATSTPQPSVSRFTTSARFCERALTVTAAPSVLASSSFASSTSLTITRAHPAARARQQGDEADGAGARDDRDVARLDLRLGRGVHAGRQRLHHRGLLQRDVVRQLEGEVCGVHHVRSQDAVDRRRRPEAHGRIEVVDAEAAGPAGRVGDARLHADPVAFLELGHIGADFENHAGGLVPQDHGRAHLERADPAVGVIVHVAAADADVAQADPHVAEPQRLLDLDVAQGQLVPLFQYDSLDHDPSPLIRATMMARSAGTARSRHTREYEPPGCASTTGEAPQRRALSRIQSPADPCGSGATGGSVPGAVTVPLPRAGSYLTHALAT